MTRDLHVTGTNQTPSTFQGDKLPVETNSWIDAVRFCNTLSTSLERDKCHEIDLVNESVTLDSEANGFRLPTEAEWPYACQAGNKNIRYGELSEIAWFKGNSNNHTQKVGQKMSNDWGIYDMLGNVWEWCTDIYDETVYGSYRVFVVVDGATKKEILWRPLEEEVILFFKIDDLGFRIMKNK